MLVSIVIPAYNEEAVIEEHLESIRAHCEPKPWEYEVLVVDDGSSDRTASLVRAFSERCPQVGLLGLGGNRGKGHAVRKGLLSVRGDVRGFTDADGATPIYELDRVLAELEAGAGVVIGSRAKRASGTRLDAHLHRKAMGRVFNGLLRVLVGLRDADGVPLADTQCGFKWFSAAACDAILPRASLDGFAFDVELLYLANRLGHPVREIAVDWSDRGGSTVNLLLDPLRMLYRSALVPLKHRGVG